MKKLLSLTKRNLLEIIRDPLSAIFIIAFPVVMLIFMQLLISGFEFIPVNFQIQNYAPGICVFGYTFTGMFLATNIASDKNNSFIKRIKISPVNYSVYLLSYVLSGFIIVLVQTVLFYAIALIFKLPFNAKLFVSLVYLLPSALFYLSFGVLLGSVCKNEKQSGPISSIMISLTGILGGVFMPITTFTGGFATVINALPFSHTVLIASEVYLVGASCFYPHILYILGYTALLWVVIILSSKRKN